MLTAEETMKISTTPAKPNTGWAKWIASRVASNPPRPNGKAKRIAAKRPTKTAGLAGVMPSSDGHESGYSQHACAPWQNHAVTEVLTKSQMPAKTMSMAVALFLRMRLKTSNLDTRLISGQ